MSLELQRPELTELKPRITVIGVGGAGGNAVANMIASGLEGVDFVVANTDAQALSLATAETRLQLGLKITQGLGAGSRPEIGRAAAEETLAEIEGALDGSHMCFITAGMGGGTGTGAAPVVAKAARERGILTVGVVTKPFAFEGARRMRSAEEGIAELQKHVDTLIIIPNQNLFLIANANTSFKEAFAMADQVLHQGVRGITDLMIMPGLINLDFADIRTVMSEMGKAMMGTGEADGPNRAIEAAEKAIANPLLDEVSMRGAKGVIINITGGDDLKLMEVDEAANHIREMVDPDANIIVGSAFNTSLEGRMRVSVVATGIDASAKSAEMPARASVSGFGAVTGGFGAATPVRAVPLTERPVVDRPVLLDPPVAAEDTAPEAEPAIEAAVAEAPSFIDNVMPLRMPEPAPVPEPEAQADPAPAVEPAPIAEAEERPYAMRAPEPKRQDTRGPTLFERMMNLSRGAEKARLEEPEVPAADDVASQDPLEIPRFFRRQVND
jgi:cell division protein FtsZ